MRVDQLMDAIEEIDDRYIEEGAYSVRRKSYIPWGMIITAACFCLAIGATMFMQSLGILPHLNGTTGATSQPTVPSNTETTVSQPTVALPSPETFFSDMESWPNAALGYTFQISENVEFYFLLKESRLGEGIVLTEEEQKLLDDKLQYGFDFTGVWRLTPAQIDDIFWSCYGLTWKEVISNFDLSRYSGWNPLPYVPVYLEETGCYYGYTGIEKGTEITDVEVEYCDDGTINMFYTAFGSERRVAKLRPHDTGYHILSNKLIERFSERTDPIVMKEIVALFRDKDSWYYRALVDTFESPKQLHLRYYFYNNTEFGGGLQPTKQEMDELMALQPDGGTPTLVILPASKMDVILTEIFGITVSEMESTAFAGMKYAKSIDSWCFWGIGTLDVVKISIHDVVKEVGDIFRIVYTAGEEIYEVTLKPYGDGYRILSNVVKEPS